MEISYYPSKDILQSTCHVITIPVNAVGVMGAGLALQFAIRYPEMCEYYKAVCKEGNYKAGDVILLTMFAQYAFRQKNVKPGDYIPKFALLATKQHWKDPSKPGWVWDGLKELKSRIAEFDHIKSVALPPLGCGLGGLSWVEIHALILRVFEDTDLQVCIYGAGNPEPNRSHR